jgi:hypothetical protein
VHVNDLHLHVEHLVKTHCPHTLWNLWKRFRSALIIKKKFNPISNDKNYSKFNISCTLGLKISKSLFIIFLLIKGFLTIPKSVAKFSYRFLVLIYMNFQMKTCSIFNDLKSKHGTLNTTIAKTWHLTRQNKRSCGTMLDKWKRL